MLKRQDSKLAYFPIFEKKYFFKNTKFIFSLDNSLLWNVNVSMLWVWASSGFKDKTIVPSSGVLQCQTALWPLITYIHFYPSFERVRKWDTEISHIWQVNWKTKEQISPGIYTFHPETKHRMCKNGQDDWPTNSPTLQSVVCQFLSIGCAGKTSLLPSPYKICHVWFLCMCGMDGLLLTSGVNLM